MASADFVVDDEVKWKAFIQLNRTRLVTELDYESLSREALKRGICTEEDVKRIKFNSSANFRRVGAFLDSLIKKTKVEYNKFRECLKCMNEAAKAIDKMLQDTFPEYERSLEEQMRHLRPRRQRNRLRGDAVPQFNPAEPASAEKIEEIKKRIADVKAPAMFKCSEPGFYDMQKKDSYKIGKKRGRALVVTMTGDREGWEPDVIVLDTMFKALEIVVEHCFDPKMVALQDILDRFAQSNENEEADCVFLVIMGHGGRSTDNKDYLITADGCPFWVEDEIRNSFNNEVAFHLREKPKVFISQMCRGTAEDKGIVHTDSNTFTRSLPTWSDFLFGYATLPGYKAYRHDQKGSWYIQELASVFLKEAHCESVTDMLTKVNREIDQKNEEIKMPTVMTACLNHKLFLFPGIKP